MYTYKLRDLFCVCVCVCVCVCDCVCLCPAGYHADSIPLNYYNGLLMGLTVVEGEEGPGTSQRSMFCSGADRFHNLWVRWFYSTIKVNVKALSEVAGQLSGLGRLATGHVGEKWTTKCLRGPFLQERLFVFLVLSLFGPWACCGALCSGFLLFSIISISVQQSISTLYIHQSRSMYPSQVATVGVSAVLCMLRRA